MMEDKNPILQELQELTPRLTWPSKVMPLHVPNGYFEALPHRLHEIMDPVLPIGELGSGQPFFVPDNYFQLLSKRILDQTQSTPAAGNAPSFPLFYKRIVSYAAAATIGGVLVAAAILFTDSRPNRMPLQSNATISAQESSISSHTILAPDNEVYREITKKMQGVSEEEMNLYLEETASTETIEWMPEEMN